MNTAYFNIRISTSFLRGCKIGLLPAAIVLLVATDAKAQTGSQTVSELRISDNDATPATRQNVILQAPASSTLTSDQTLVLPASTPTTGQVLTVQSVAGSAASLAWTTPSTTATSVPASGVTSAADVTAGSNKITLSGTPTGATLKAFSVDVNEGNLNLANIGGTLPITKVSSTGATSGQVLGYDGTNMVWTTPSTGMGSTLASGNIYVGNASNVATAVVPTGDVTITNAGVTSIGTGKVTTTQILDGTVATADLSDASVTAAKLNQMSATSGQVLQWNGTAWAPTTPSTTATSVPASGVTSAADVTAGSNKVTLGGTPTGATLKAFSVDVNEANLNLANIGGTLPITKVSSTGASSGQVLGYNGTNMVWTTPSTTATSVPASGVTSAADVTAGSNKITLGGTPTGATLKAFSVDVNEANLNLANIGGTLPITKVSSTGASSGQVLGYNGTNMVWTTPSTTATSVPASGVTGAADVTAGSSKVTLGGTPTGATLKAFSVDVNEANLDLANIGGSLPLTKVAAGSATTGQVMTFNGTNWAPATASSGGLSTTLANGNIYVGNASNVATAVVPTGDVTITNAGVTSIGTDKVTTTQILDGTVSTADIAANAVTIAKLPTGATATTFLRGDGTWVTPTAGVTTLSAPSGTNANAGSISGSTLNLTFADATNPGIVSTAAQTFEGAKTFNKAATNAAVTVGTGTTIDFSANNLAATSAIATAYTLNNIKSGGAYTLILTGTTNTGTATFTSGGFTFKYMGTAAMTTGKTHIYSIIVVGTVGYVTMGTEN